MAISRPLLLALIGAVLAGVTLFAVQNSRESSSDNTAAPAAKTPAPAPSGKAAQPQVAKMSPNEAVEAGFSNLTFRSGKFDLDFSVKGVQGAKVESSTAQLTGTVQSQGKTEVPKFDVRLSAADAAGKYTVGAVSTGNGAYILDRDVAYKVPEAIWSEVTGVRSKIASFAKPGGAAPAGLLGLDVDASKWLTGVKDEGTETVAGVETQHVSASIDASRVMSDLSKVASQTGTDVPLPAGFEKTVAQVVKKADLDVYVGTKDRILRRVTLDVDLQLPAALGGGGKVLLDADLQLSEVNEPQQIGAPANVSSKSLNTARPQARLVGAEVLGIGMVAIDPPAGIAEAREAGFQLGDPGVSIASANNPQRLSRAVSSHRKVVLFFGQGAADDKATAEAVRQLQRKTNVLVLTDRVENADRYGEMIQDLGVNQTPAVVIVARSGKAHLLEGYVDPETLAQEVADAR
jgi:hypothetical protein